MTTLKPIMIFLCVSVFMVSVILMVRSVTSGFADVLASGNSLLCFKDSSLNERTDFSTIPCHEYSILDHKKFLLRIAGMIDRYVTSFMIATPQGPFWVTENIIVTGSDNHGHTLSAEYYFPPATVFLYACLLMLSIFTLCIMSDISSGTGRITVLSFASLFALWVAGLCFVFYINGGLFSFSHGEAKMFYQIAREWLVGFRDSQVTGNVGTAFFYLPFLLLFNSRSAIDLFVPFYMFNAVFIGGACLLLTVLVLRLMNCSRLSFYVSGMTAVLVPVFFYISLADLTKPSMLGSIGSTNLWFGLREFNSISLYHQSFLISWNGQGDSLACLVILFTFVLMIWLKPSISKYSLTGALIGFSICIRYSCAAFAPVFMFMFFNELRHNKYPLNKYVLYSGLTGVFIILGFMPQLLDNYFVQGSPFKPAVEQWFKLGDRSNVFYWTHLLNISSFLKGLKFYLTIHFKIFLVSSILLFFMKNRIFAIFLWGFLVSPLVFYSFFSFIIDPVKYMIIIYPVACLILGMIINDYLDIKGTALYILLYISGYVLVCPESPHLDYFFMFPACYHVAIPIVLGALSVVIGYILKIQYFKSLVFMLIMVMFSTGAWIVVAVALTAFPLFQIIRMTRQSVIHEA